LGVDGMLFIGGVDGRDNLGSVQALNYILGGVSGFDLLERQQPSGSWAEDVVLLVRPTSCEIHVGPAAYAGRAALTPGGCQIGYMCNQNSTYGLSLTPGCQITWSILAVIK
jgi:hypothetical protein